MENKKKIQFGLSKFGDKTPIPIKNAYRTFMFLSGIWAIVIAPQFHFPEHVVFEINRWLLVANNMFYFIGQFFGYKIEGKYK